MKFFPGKFNIILLLLFFTFSSKAANDLLTIREVFDWQAGDTFIYRATSSFTVFTHYAGASTTYDTSIVGFTVMSRIDAGDSICYSLHYFNDTVTVNFTINNIDSPLFNLTSVYLKVGCDFNLYSYDINHLYYYQDPSFNNLMVNSFNFFDIYDYRHTDFYEKIGVRNNSFSLQTPGYGGSGGTDSRCDTKLVYYKSASTGFVYSNVGENTPENMRIVVYPNPARNVLIIEKANANSAGFYQIKIYDLQSRLIYQKVNPEIHRQEEIDISNLESGVYIVSIEDKFHHSLYRKKIIKE